MGTTRRAGNSFDSLEGLFYGDRHATTEEGVPDMMIDSVAAMRPVSAGAPGIAVQA